MLSAKIVNFHKFCMIFYGFCLDLPVWPIWWHSTWYFTWVSLLRYARSVENADPKRLLSPQVLFASSSRVILATIQLIGNPIAQKYSLGMLSEKNRKFPHFQWIWPTVWSIWEHYVWYFIRDSLLHHIRKVKNADPKRLGPSPALFVSSSRVFLTTFQLIGKHTTWKYSCEKVALKNLEISDFGRLPQ